MREKRDSDVYRCLVTQFPCIWKGIKEEENKRCKLCFKVTISPCDNSKPWGPASEKKHHKEDFHTHKFYDVEYRNLCQWTLFLKAPTVRTVRRILWKCKSELKHDSIWEQSLEYYDCPALSRTHSQSQTEVLSHLMKCVLIIRPLIKLLSDYLIIVH